MMKQKKVLATYKSTGIAIPGCFCISKCLKDAVGPKNLMLYATGATTESSQVLHRILCCLSFPSSTFTTAGQMLKINTYIYIKLHKYPVLV